MWCKDCVLDTGATWMLVSETQCQILESGGEQALWPVVPTTGASVIASVSVTGGNSACVSGMGDISWSQIRSISYWGKRGILLPARGVGVVWVPKPANGGVWHVWGEFGVLHWWLEQGIACPVPAAGKGMNLCIFPKPDMHGGYMCIFRFYAA